MASTIILSDNGVNSGVAGIKTSGGNDGTLALQTTNSSGTALTGLTIDTNQNVALNNSLSSTNTFGFKNRLINGGMVIDQRNAGASVAITTSDTYVTDRFAPQIFGSGTGRFTAQQVSTVPTGFTKSLQLTVTTADASPAAGYGYCIQQRIEGYNVADLLFGSASAQTVTVSFWVRSSVTGSFGFLLNNSNVTRNYGVLYTINSANTWEFKTITIAGDTTGTWETTNLNGLGVTFSLGGGSTRTVSTGWNANATGSTPSFVTGGTNLMATNGATFYITGVQLEKGTQATSFDFRSYGTELALCQRYYEQTFMVFSTSYSTSYPTAYYAVEKRATPTFTYVLQAGSGATVSSNFYTPTRGFYQNANNSQTSSGQINVSAEL